VPLCAILPRLCFSHFIAFSRTCPQCKTASPIYGKMSTEFSNVLFLKVSRVAVCNRRNQQHRPYPVLIALLAPNLHLRAQVDVDVARDVASACSISAMPTFKVYRDGKECGSVRGWSESAVRDLLMR
jgi:hypothetical protein